MESKYHGSSNYTTTLKVKQVPHDEDLERLELAHLSDLLRTDWTPQPAQQSSRAAEQQSSRAALTSTWLQQQQASTRPRLEQQPPSTWLQQQLAAASSYHPQGPGLSSS
ncbi:unnamed protein product [Arctogadus glacialis]